MPDGFNINSSMGVSINQASLRAAVRSVEGAFAGVSPELNVRVNARAAKDIQAIDGQTRKLSVSLAAAATEAAKLERSLAAVGAMGGLAGKSFGAMNTGASQFGASVKKASGSVKQLDTEIKVFGADAALAVRRFTAFSAGTTIIFGLTNAISGAIAESIDFQKQVVRIAQVTDTSTKLVGNLTDEVTRLSTTLGVSSKELLDVSLTLAQAGLSADKTKKALQAIAKSDLAPTFNSMGETVEGVISILSQFGDQAKGTGVQVEDLESVLGSINAVSAKFAVESGDIIAAVRRTGSAFASASRGVSEGKNALNEFIAVFTSIRATTRESAETIATGLRTIFTRLGRIQTIDFLKKFNIDLVDSKNNFVGAFEAVKRLAGGLNELNPRNTSFFKISEELGGYRQVNKVIPLIGEFAKAQAALRVARRGDKSLDKDAIQGQEAFAVQLTKVRENFLALIRDVSNTTSFKALLDIVTGGTNQLIKMAAAFKQLIPIIATFAGFKAITGGFQFLSGFVGGFKKRKDDQNSLSGAVGVVGPAAATVNTAGLSLATALSSNTSALQANTAALNRSSVGGAFRKFAKGGFVPGTGNTDSVPSLLTPGELVIPKDMVQKFAFGNQAKATNKLPAKGLAKFLRDILGLNIDEDKIDKLVPNIGTLPDLTSFGLSKTTRGIAYAQSGQIAQKNSATPLTTFHEIIHNSDRLLFENLIAQDPQYANADLKDRYASGLQGSPVNKLAARAAKALIPLKYGSLSSFASTNQAYAKPGAQEKEGLAILSELYSSLKLGSFYANNKGFEKKAGSFGLSLPRSVFTNPSDEVKALLKEFETQYLPLVSRVVNKGKFGFNDLVNGKAPIKRNSGGYVPGEGNTDSVHGLLTPGEYVIRKPAVQAIERQFGRGALAQLNTGSQRGNKPKFSPEDAGLPKEFWGLAPEAQVGQYISAYQSGRVPTSQQRDYAAYLGLKVDSKTGTPIIGKQATNRPAGPVSDVIIGQAGNPLFGGFFLQNSKGKKLQSNREQKLTQLKPAQRAKLEQDLPQANLQDNSYVKSFFQFGFIEDQTEKRFTDRAKGNIAVSVTDLLQNFGAEKLSTLPTPEASGAVIKNSNLGGAIGSMFESYVSILSGNTDKASSEEVFDIPTIGTKKDALKIMFGNFKDSVRAADLKKDISSKKSVNDLIKKSVNTATPEELRFAASTGSKADKKVSDVSVGSALDYRRDQLVFALGGEQSGKDSIPALLTPGEYVIQESAARKIGLDKLNAMNRADTTQSDVIERVFSDVPGFNKGGQTAAAGRIPRLGVNPKDAYKLAMRGEDTSKPVSTEYKKLIEQIGTAYKGGLEKLSSDIREIKSLNTNVEAQKAGVATFVKALVSGTDEVEAFAKASSAINSNVGQVRQVRQQSKTMDFGQTFAGNYKQSGDARGNSEKPKFEATRLQLKNARTEASYQEIRQRATDLAFESGGKKSDFVRQAASQIRQEKQAKLEADLTSNAGVKKAIADRQPSLLSEREAQTTKYRKQRGLGPVEKYIGPPAPPERVRRTRFEELLGLRSFDAFRTDQTKVNALAEQDKADDEAKRAKRTGFFGRVANKFAPANDFLKNNASSIAFGGITAGGFIGSQLGDNPIGNGVSGLIGGASTGAAGGVLGIAIGGIAGTISGYAESLNADAIKQATLKLQQSLENSSKSLERFNNDFEGDKIGASARFNRELGKESRDTITQGLERDKREAFGGVASLLPQKQAFLIVNAIQNLGPAISDGIGSIGNIFGAGFKNDSVSKNNVNIQSTSTREFQRALAPIAAIGEEGLSRQISGGQTSVGEVLQKFQEGDRDTQDILRNIFLASKEGTRLATKLRLGTEQGDDVTQTNKEINDAVIKEFAKKFEGVFGGLDIAQELIDTEKKLNAERIISISVIDQLGKRTNVVSEGIDELNRIVSNFSQIGQRTATGQSSIVRPNVDRNLSGQQFDNTAFGNELKTAARNKTLIENELPRLLDEEFQRASIRKTEGGDETQLFTDISKLFGDGSYVTSQLQKALGEKFFAKNPDTKDIKDLDIAEYRSITGDITKDLVPVVNESVENIQRAVEATANAADAYANQLRTISGLLIAAEEKRLEAANFTADQAIEAKKRAGETVTFADIIKPIQNELSSLGVSGKSPQSISSTVLSAQAQKRQLETQRDGVLSTRGTTQSGKDEILKLTTQIEGLQTVIDNNNKGLGVLANSTAALAFVNEKIAAIRQDRQAIKGTITDFVTAGPAQLQEFTKQISTARAFVGSKDAQGRQVGGGFIARTGQGRADQLAGLQRLIPVLKEQARAAGKPQAEIDAIDNVIPNFIERSIPDFNKKSKEDQKLIRSAIFDSLKTPEDKQIEAITKVMLAAKEQQAQILSANAGVLNAQVVTALKSPFHDQIEAISTALADLTRQDMFITSEGSIFINGNQIGEVKGSQDDVKAKADEVARANTEGANRIGQYQLPAIQPLVKELASIEVRPPAQSEEEVKARRAEIDAVAMRGPSNNKVQNLKDSEVEKTYKADQRIFLDRLSALYRKNAEELKAIREASVEQARRDAAPAFAYGGRVPGVGNTDSHPAMLMPGEFVINKRASAENLALLEHINRGGTIQQMATGGYFQKAKLPEPTQAMKEAAARAKAEEKAENDKRLFDNARSNARLKEITKQQEADKASIVNGSPYSYEQITAKRKAEEDASIKQFQDNQLKEGAFKRVARIPTAPNNGIEVQGPFRRTAKPVEITREQRIAQIREERRLAAAKNPVVEPTAPSVSPNRAYADMKNQEVLDERMAQRQKQKEKQNAVLAERARQRQKQKELQDRVLGRSNVQKPLDKPLDQPPQRVANFSLPQQEYLGQEGKAIPVGSDRIQAAQMKSFADSSKQNRSGLAGYSGKVRGYSVNQQSEYNKDKMNSNPSVEMSQFNDAFAASVNRLDGIVDKLSKVTINGTIEIKGKHTVEVVLNGAEALKNMAPEIKKIVEDKITDSMRKKFNVDGSSKEFA